MPTLIRPATLRDAAAIAHVQVESWQTTYTGIVPFHALAALSKDTQRQMFESQLDVPTTLTYVAEQEGYLSGFIGGGPARNPSAAYSTYDAELYAIYLLESHQRQGTGRALVQTLAAALHSRSYKSLLVWALEANPAVRFYQHLGAIPITTSQVNIGGVDLPELGLGWPSLTTLLS